MTLGYIRKRDRVDPKLLRKKVDTPLTTAIREEIKRLADEKEFTLGTLRSIERVAAHGRAMLQGTADLDGLLGGRGGGADMEIDGLADDLMGNYSGVISGSSSVENFGTRAMRELTAMLPKILEGRNRPSTVELVRALAVARKEGLDEVAKDLQKQIKGATTDTPKPATPLKRTAESKRALPPGSYWKPCSDLPDGGRYIERGDPEWRLVEYNWITASNAKAGDFAPVTIDAPELGDAA